ncbi:short-chain dehydrogenase [Xylariaceae sp. FL1019]|nr:short-chain dehydrogenase [Xylariaceae sp. FL1019]
MNLDSAEEFPVYAANTGIGQDVARILYSKNATVWVTARNDEKGANGIASITEEHPESKGALKFYHLDLRDLSIIKAATKLLTPALVETAKTAPKNSVRVVWVSSSTADHLTPTGGIDLDNLDYKRDFFYDWKYGMSKAGDYYHATKYARQHREYGIISVSLNPGNLRTELDRNRSIVERWFRYATVYPVINGAYTELYAGYQIMEVTGIAEKFWKWSEEQTTASA